MQLSCQELLGAIHPSILPSILAARRGFQVSLSSNLTSPLCQCAGKDKSTLNKIPSKSTSSLFQLLITAPQAM